MSSIYSIKSASIKYAPARDYIRTEKSVFPAAQKSIPVDASKVLNILTAMSAKRNVNRLRDSLSGRKYGIGWVGSAAD